MASTSKCKSPGNNGQRGAFSIIAAITLLTLIALLGLVIDGGRLYLEQRQLQKIADMAAMEAVARLPDGNCAASPENATVFAVENAARHGFESAQNQNLLAECVQLTTQNNLREGTPDATGRAVRVTVTREVQSSLVLIAASTFNGSLMRNTELTAIAIAEREEPAAAFSVGAQLLNLDDEKLLSSLLASVGLNTERLTILDSNGVANASITPAGLLHALGIDIGIHQLKALSPQELVNLVNTEIGLVGLDELVNLSLTLISDNAAKAGLEALSLDILDSTISDAQVQLFGTAELPGLLSIDAGADNSIGAAMDAQINVGDLLKTGLLIGASGRALHVPELDLMGFAQVQLGIVEPPSIGVGPVGARAYNAQIRLYADVDTNNILGGVLAWLTETVLGTHIHLPIWIDVTTGQGTLSAVDCGSETPTADILVESRILNMCIGEVPDAVRWSTQNSCADALAGTELIRLLHLPVLSGKAELPALEHEELVQGIGPGQTASSSPNPIALGDTVDGLVSGLLDLLGGLFRPPTELDGDLDYSQAGQNVLIANLASQYLEATKQNGLYNVTAATNLVLNGSDEYDSNGNQVVAPLVNEDWHLPNGVPTRYCLIVCVVTWNDGSFSQAFGGYANPALLGLLNLPTDSDYRFCGGLLNQLLDWNNCLRHNLTKFLQEKPGGINISQSQDGNNLANPANNNVTCSGALCLLLKPMLELLKPVLNGIGSLLDTTLADVLGLELGRTDVHVQSISCGAPTLVH